MAAAATAAEDEAVEAGDADDNGVTAAACWCSCWMGWTVAVWATGAEVESEGVGAATTAGELVAKMAACSDTTAREEATTLSMSLMAEATCKLLLLLWLLSP